MLKHMCRVWGHRRSRSKARLHASTWRSECRHCGQRLERVSRKNWQSLEFEPLFRVVTSGGRPRKLTRLVTRLAAAQR